MSLFTQIHIHCTHTIVTIFEFIYTCSFPYLGGTGDADRPVDVSRLNLKVGKIINVKKHPDADTLYVEEGGFWYWCYYEIRYFREIQ